MNKFLTIYLNTVETIEATANQIINLIFQPLYCVARIIIATCEIWGVPYEAEESEENNKKPIGFQRQ